MSSCCACPECHIIFEDSVEYDESISLMEAHKDLFYKLFVIAPSEIAFNTDCPFVWAVLHWKGFVF